MTTLHKMTAASTSHSENRFTKLLICGGRVPARFGRLPTELQVASRPMYTLTSWSHVRSSADENETTVNRINEGMRT